MNDQVWNIKFVEEVEKRDVLYNYKLPGYSRKDITEKAWQEVAAEVKITALVPPSSGNLPQITQHETTDEIFENSERCDDDSGSLEDSSDMNIVKLSHLYEHPDDVDYVVGGSLEAHVNGALSGPSFLCVMVEQFYRTRAGDKFFYENGDHHHSFTHGEQQMLIYYI
uniref:MADF domain-containing protein n=1 Tax=Timema cristinae TaxID=61476 RepID=A0A7R9D9S0_TIMCR|nr:unnamed protein product [Timema cristinae]